MLPSVMMRAMLLFPDIVIRDDMDMSANEATREFAYLMREKIGLNFLGYDGRGSVLMVLALQYYRADAVTDFPPPENRGNGQDYARDPIQLPVRTNSGLSSKRRRWWHRFRRSQAGPKKEGKKEGEKER
jgi:hypothetical protein